MKKTLILAALALAALCLVGAGAWLIWGMPWGLFIAGGLLWIDLVLMGIESLFASIFAKTEPAARRAKEPKA